MNTSRAEKYCSHCQKERPVSCFGVNRNKTPKNGKPEEFRTCEECRIKVAKQKQGLGSSTPATPRQIFAPSGFRPINGDSARRNPRRQMGEPTFVPVERVESRKQAINGIEAQFTQESTLKKVMVISDRESASPAPPPAKKRARTDSRTTNGAGARISESPPALKHGRAEMPVEIDESENEFDDQHTVVNGNHAEDDGSSIRDRTIIAKELLEFAQGLERLGGLLFAALEELDDETVEGLQNEIRHDWRVEEMGTFVEGYLKGAKKRNGSRW